jgi:RNA polymerase sigma-70 factor (ECF subfamily)
MMLMILHKKFSWKVYESLGYFRHEAKLSTWIYRIAVNKSLNYLKKTKRKSLLKAWKKFQPGRKNELSGSLVEAADKGVESGGTEKNAGHCIEQTAENQRIAFVLFPV